MIAELLSNGQVQGMTAREIQEQHGLSPREIRKMVNFERTVHGALICSGRRGYYEGNDSEVLDTIHRLRKMAAADIEVADSMERSLRQRQGQEIMDGW